MTEQGLRSSNGKQACPPYSQGPYTWDQMVNFSAGVSGNNVVLYKGANVWFVDKTNVSTAGDGKSWETAFRTLTAALAVAGDYDVIFVGPGFYTEATALTITQTGLKIIGCNSSGKTRGPCALKGPTAAGHIIQIDNDVNDVEIGNISFIQDAANYGIRLGSAASGYCWRTHIHNCAFFGDSTGTYAIGVYGATTTPSAGAFPDVAECVVEDCYFYAWTSASLCVYGTRTMVRNNVIFGLTGDVGIVAGIGRPFGVISGNKINMAGTATGILVTGDDDTGWICEGNCIVATTTITQDVSNGAVLSNNPIVYNSNTPYVVDANSG